VLLGLALGGCTAIEPAVAPPPAAVETFSHADLDRVLGRFVDEHGRVDYPGLAADPGDLDRYHGLLAAYSPDSHAALFPTRQARLAYWVNAYNAAVLQIVVRHYPIASVSDVRPPAVLFFAPRRSGFFLFQRVTLGGRRTSLYALENGLIRRRFREPRVHFALNCASRGCPRLPQHAFSAERLDEELDRETRRFLAEERNLRIDHAREEVWLSSIFDWYAADFRGAQRRARPAEPPTVLAWVVRHVDAERASELGRAASYRPRFVPYDWRLNDREP
jgi:hypothetical protein